MDRGNEDGETIRHDGDPPMTSFRKYELLVANRLSYDDLRITLTGIFRVMLLDVDRFSALLGRPTTNPSRLVLGDRYGAREFYPLDISSIQDVRAWNTFCGALGNLEDVRRAILGGYNIQGKEMTTIVESLPAQVETIDIRMPFFTLHPNEAPSLCNALSNHPCQSISIEITGSSHGGGELSDIDWGAWAKYEEVFSELLLIDGIEKITLQNLVMTIDECQAIADQLSSNASTMSALHISNSCLFPGGGGDLIASALRNNTRLTSLELTADTFKDDAFTKALFESLPLNESIEKFQIMSLKGPPPMSIVLPLLKAIAAQNTTMKTIRVRQHEFYSSSIELSEEETQELQQALKENHTLECVEVGYEEPFSIITSLNQAGRRYLGDEEQASSKAACIQVLSNPIVNNNLDCLYFHLRENPVLFTGTMVAESDSNLDEIGSTKRKTLDGGESDLPGDKKRRQS